ncbi:MAG TPA: hypothetical protein VJB87_01130 [Candidatus Nanoarchaeia archaeon]|nr:hypothetical protein [Candidatus Nanoarchaeia archaeon]
MKCWRHKEDGSLCENEGTLTTPNGFPLCVDCKDKVRLYVDPKNVVAIAQQGSAMAGHYKKKE